MVEQCGQIQRVPLDGGEPTVVPRHLRRARHLRRRAGAALGRLRPRLRATRAASTSTTPTRTATRERSSTSARPTTRPSPTPSSAGSCCRSTDFASNHNGGLLQFGPDGRLYLGMGDGGGAGDPSAPPRTRDSRSASSSRSTPPSHGASSDGSAALGLRNPWRYSFDRRRPAIWIGDVGQDTFEEIDAVPRRQLGPRRNFGWSAFEGDAALQRRPAGARARRPPVFVYSHDAAARSPAATSSATRTLDLAAAATSTATTARASCTASRPTRRPRDATTAPSASTVPQLSSFGEDADGHVYAVSLDGPVYRLVRRAEPTRALIEMTDRRGRALIAATRLHGRRAALGCVRRGARRADRPRRARRGAEARPGRRLQRAGLRRRTRRARSELLFVVEQPGTIRVVRERQDAQAAVPRHPRPRAATAASRGCSRSPSTPTTRSNRRFYVYYVNNDGNIEVDGFRRKRGIATRAEARLAPHGDRRSPHPQFAEPQRRPAAVRPRRLPLPRAPATAAAAGDPHGNAQNPNVLLGKLLRIDPTHEASGYSDPELEPVRRAAAAATRSTRSGCATRSASPSTAARTTSTSATSARTAGRRSTHVSRRPLAAPNFGWDIFEGTHDFEGGGAPATLPTPGARVLPAAATAPSPAATSSAAPRCGRSPAATSTPTSAAASCARSILATRAPSDASDRPRRRPAELVRRGPRRAHLRRLARRPRLRIARALALPPLRLSCSRASSAAARAPGGRSRWSPRRARRDAQTTDNGASRARHGAPRPSRSTARSTAR